MTHRARRALVVVSTLLSLTPCAVQADTKASEAASAPAVGEDEALYRCKSRDAEVAINFKPDIELKELMTWVVGFTCKNFILDPRVVTTGKKVTVIAPNKMTATEAYRLFLVALSTMSLTVVPKGKILRITDAGAARRDTVPIIKNGLPADNDQVVRYVLRPTYAQPDTLTQALATLKSEIGDVTQIGSMVMLTDYAGNIRDMLQLVKIVDVPKGSEGIYTIPIQHADATKLADEIGGILGIGTAAAPSKPPPSGAATPVATTVPSKVMVDARTNTILLTSSEAGYQRFAALVARLDIPLEVEGGATIHVFRLGNAIAEELAKTLTDAIGQGNSNPQNANGTTGNPAGVFPSPLDGLAVKGQVRVIADKPTNKLIVMSSGRDYLAVKDVIAALDEPRPQVYIEAMIVEVNIGDQLDLDGSLHGARDAFDKALLLGGVHTVDTLNSADPKTSFAKTAGFIGGLLGKSTSFLGITIPSYGILFSALADKSRANILSTPSVMALDNETAKFKVGKNIPYQRGLSFGGTTTSTDNPFGAANVNVDRKDLNLEIEVKPHISSGDSVLLELKHTAEDQGDTLQLGPTWNTRSIETRILVRDQQSIVIGGLMQERIIKTRSQVPLLGDLPLLGYFFSHTNHVKRKSNLLILLTPYIVKNQLELQAIKDRKIREHEEFVGSFQIFESMKYQPKIDYRRKRGLVEEINRSIQEVDEDRRLLDSVKKQPGVPSGAIELPEGDGLH